MNKFTVDGSSLHDFAERLSQHSVTHALFIDEQPSEEGVVEESACRVDGAGVQRGDVSDHRHGFFQNLGPGRQLGTAAVLVGLDAGSVLAQFVEAGPDLALRESFLCEVDETFLALIEVGQALAQRLIELSQAGLFVVQRFADAFAHQLGEGRGQRQGLVVPDDLLLNQADREVRQVTAARLSRHAEVVAVEAAGAPGLGVDQLANPASLMAAPTVELLLEVVEVDSVAAGWRRSFGQDVLGGREQFGLHQGLMPSREDLTFVGDHAHVVRIT